MRNYDLFDKLRETLGDEELLNNLMKAMSQDEMNDNLEYIAKMWDVE